MDLSDEQQTKTLNQVETLLQELILPLAPLQEEGPIRGRPRILPAFCLWAGLLVCVLRGSGSQLALWRLLTQKGLWSYPQLPLSDQAVYKRLEQGGLDSLMRLFTQLSALLRARLAAYIAHDLAPFASQVVALDVTTLDPVARLLPSLRKLPKGDPLLLPGRLAALFDLRAQQWQQVQYIADAHENEKCSARALLTDLTPASLVLADLGYFSFRWFDELTSRGHFWISRLRQKTSYTVVHTYYQQGDTFDGLIWLGAYRADQARYAVRLVSYRVGPNVYRYITNVIAPQQLPLAEIARLYARRWDIELGFKLLKRELGLHLFWSAKPGVILQQVWAALIIAQVLLGLRLEIAGRAGVDPFDVSLPLMIEYIPRWSADGTDMIAFFVERGRQAGFIRPSRRVAIRAPVLEPDQIHPLPPGTALERQPHYADKS